MKIVFMGTPRPAAVSLARLIERGHEVVAVYTQPDRPSGRGKQISFSPVKELSLEHQIPVEQPVKVRTHEAFSVFEAYKADVAVVVAYGRILPESFLSAFRYGAVNVHFSLLPKYRGAAPVNWAIVNGETETGVTTMRMDAGLDTGDILLQSRTAIAPTETSIHVMERLAELGADLLLDTLDSIGSLVGRPQDHESATFAPILKKEDGICDFSMTAAEIVNRIRGFQPFPGVYTFFNGSKLTFWSASARQDDDGAREPGTISGLDNERISIACGTGSLLDVSEIQAEGKRRLSVRDFLNGSRLAIGDRLGKH